MFFRDWAFWCSVLVAWAVLGFGVICGLLPMADGWPALFERWISATAVVYSLHALAYITILAALERAASVAAMAASEGGGR